MITTSYSDRLLPGREHKVFINCPYSEDFFDLWCMLNLAVIAGGLWPDSDFDNLQPEIPDISTLAGHIFGSRYSIHECTYCSGDQPDRFGRFNVPVELGMALLEQKRGFILNDNNNHKVLILSSNEHPYRQCISTFIEGPGVVTYSSHYDMMKKVLYWLNKQNASFCRITSNIIQEILKKAEETNIIKELREISHASQSEIHDHLFLFCSKQNWWRRPSWMTYDVFLAHNSHDKPHIQVICEELRRRDLKPWLDNEQIAPGQWFQKVLQDNIPRVKTAAIFVGPMGLGQWQELELQSFISECVNRHIPVIPVLLPGVSEFPAELRFLKDMQMVHFQKDVHETEALDRLVWGITGKRPERDF